MDDLRRFETLILATRQRDLSDPWAVFLYVIFVNVFLLSVYLAARL